MVGVERETNAFKSFYHFGGTIHQNISSSALTPLGVSEKSFQTIDNGNTGQDDFSHYNFGDAAHHFDNCMFQAGVAYVNAQRSYIRQQAVKAHTDASARREILEAFGELIHTVQDFYSHTNYVELYLKGNPSIQPRDVPIANWGALPAGLRSGYFFYRSTATNEMTYSRDQAIDGLVEDGFRALNLLYTDALTARRKTYADYIDYATAPRLDFLHRDVNKDDDTTEEGGMVVPATRVTLHAYAFDLAVRETERQWKTLESMVREAYPEDAEAIIRALKADETLDLRQVVVLVSDKDDPTKAITGAQVVLGALSASTDGKGHAVLAVPPGKYTCVISAEGYKGAGPFAIEINAAEKRKEQKVSLEYAPVQVAILVEDKKGSISGARVSLSADVELGSGVTGADGQVIFRVRPGVFKVHAIAEGYEAVDADVEAAARVGGSATIRLVAKRLDEQTPMIGGDEWSGRWGGQSKFTYVVEGKPTSGQEAIVLLVERHDNNLTITRVDQPAPLRLAMKVQITPGNPLAAVGSGEQVNSVVPQVRTTVHYKVSAFIREGKLYITIHNEATTVIKLDPKGPETRATAVADMNAVLTPVK